MQQSHAIEDAPDSDPRAVAYFDQDTVDALRSDAQDAGLVEGRQPDGWSESRVDPARIVAIFCSLRLKDGFTLRGYIHSAAGNAKGVVWAVPNAVGGSQPRSVLDLGRFLGFRPKPAGAIDPMEAIEGDGSPLSYLSASLLSRELREFGARWHGCGWSTHTILCQDPWADPPPEISDYFERHRGLWKWAISRHGDWRARIVSSGDRREAVFFSFTAFGQQQIIRHIDRYSVGCYVPETTEETVGLGPVGYIV